MNSNFDYKKYFDSIKPETQEEVYDRFLFAFLSVHTTWQLNIKAYQLIKNKYWTSTRKTWLKNKLIKSRIGMYNNRSDFITEFTDKFLNNPEWYMKNRHERWTKYRNRLMDNIKGLGHAKSSFAIEMLYPNACLVTCVDTHIAQLHGVRQEKLSRSGYDLVEEKCLEMARMMGLMPTEWRWSWWDNKQGHDNPRYWSYVLE